MIQQPQDNGRAQTAGGELGATPPASRFALRHACLAATLLLAFGCGGATRRVEIPRKVGGQTQLGRFVPPFAYEAYVRGELALARGDAGSAVSAFELASAAPDEDPYVLSRLAWAQALTGDKKSAQRTLKHAAKIDACSEPVWITRARLAERDRDWPQARDDYAEASHCAPTSAQGPLGLAHALVALGERERAQAVLEAFALRGENQASFEAALELALSREDAVAVGVAIEGLLSVSAPSAQLLSQAIEHALAMERPFLAARLAEHAKPPIAPALATRVCLARNDIQCAQGTLALTTIDALGGPTQAAELLVAAELFERAEVEASVALATLPSPRLYLARARARAALGDTQGALADLSEAEGAPEARTLLIQLTRDAGLVGLAQELTGSGDITAKTP